MYKTTTTTKRLKQLGTLIPIAFLLDFFLSLPLQRQKTLPCLFRERMVGKELDKYFRLNVCVLRATI